MTGPRGNPQYRDTETKKLTVRLSHLAADAEALARVEGKSLNEIIKDAVSAALEQRRLDPEFKQRVRQIIEVDRELLKRLANCCEIEAPLRLNASS